MIHQGKSWHTLFVLMVLGKKPWYEKSLLTRISDLSRMRVPVTPASKLPRANKELIKEERNLEWVVKEEEEEH